MSRSISAAATCREVRPVSEILRAKGKAGEIDELRVLDHQRLDFRLIGEGYDPKSGIYGDVGNLSPGRRVCSTTRPAVSSPASATCAIMRPCLFARRR